MPIKNPNVSDNNLPNMVAWYILREYPIAVNLKQMKYVLLSKK